MSILFVRAVRTSENTVVTQQYLFGLVTNHAGDRKKPQTLLAYFSQAGQEERGSLDLSTHPFVCVYFDLS